jgi:hypothetical protein
MPGQEFRRKLESLNQAAKEYLGTNLFYVETGLKISELLDRILALQAETEEL